MLCFASAQDRTDPRRIKSYFNANAAHPPGPAARWMAEHLVTTWKTEEGTAGNVVFRAAS